jgi:putative two-component system response regulator
VNGLTSNPQLKLFHFASKVSMPSPKRILVADDDHHIRLFLQTLLSSWGHEVELAEDGFSALAKLEFDFDLLITDADMPGLDGFEVIHRVRSQPQLTNLPIIMVTGRSSVEDRVRAIEAGVNDFISKPFDSTELKVRTTSLLRQKELQDEIRQHKVNLEQTIQRRTESLHRALDDLADQQRKLHNSNLETIHHLVIASEYKDRDTSMHIKRMSRISELLAFKLRLAPKDVELILYASPMHDIGKIGTPENILLKPGKLNDQDWEIMRQHPLIGADILKGSSSVLLQIGEIIAISHHEKWNGKGYPNGLSGEAIPLQGRICAVADVFDALTSKRPYKEAFSPQEALAIIQNDSGQHFDPTIVEVLTDNIAEITKIRQIVI